MFKISPMLGKRTASSSFR